jgi:hypothetical protein
VPREWAVVRSGVGVPCSPIPCDGLPVPAQDYRGLDGEDFVLAASGRQRGQGGEPQAICRLVADGAGDLPTENGVLVPEH